MSIETPGQRSSHVLMPCNKTPLIGTVLEWLRRSVPSWPLPTWVAVSLALSSSLSRLRALG